MGLMRMDNSYKILYSDLEHMNLSEYGEIQSPMDLDVYLIKQKQSKTNTVSFIFSCLFFLFDIDTRMEHYNTYVAALIWMSGMMQWGVFP